MHTLGDRRGHGRLSVAGQFWAALHLRESVSLRNIGHGGALLEVSLGSPALTARIGELRLGDDGPSLSVVVRHSRRVDRSDGRQCHLIGVAFVSVSPLQRRALSAYLRRNDRGSRPE